MSIVFSFFFFFFSPLIILPPPPFLFFPPHLWSLLLRWVLSSPLIRTGQQTDSGTAMISLGGGGGGGASSSSSSSSSAARMSGPKTRPKPPQTKWRTGTQQKIYGRRLLDALRATGAAGAPQPRAVKAAADSALALTARGQTRWSRAILLSSCRRRVLVRAGGKIRRHQRRPQAAKASSSEPPALKERKVKERLRVLGRLVPGCRKLPAPVLLEEAADYVAALEMQVKTMRALADALAAAQLDDMER